VKTSLFYLPSVGGRSDIERGLAGLRGDLYAQMLSEVSEQARLADALCYDSISFSEHHFHIEGFEFSNNLASALTTERATPPRESQR
jgi:alkanesulfonate monooxygenase SsuD/methylene tetrahydromethanopterin reductase-like flavin-dependent oxidoreductase (luciferase family)